MCPWANSATPLAGKPAPGRKGQGESPACSADPPPGPTLAAPGHHGPGTPPGICWRISAVVMASVVARKSHWRRSSQGRAGAASPASFRRSDGPAKRLQSTACEAEGKRAPKSAGRRASPSPSGTRPESVVPVWRPWRAQVVAPWRNTTAFRRGLWWEVVRVELVKNERVRLQLPHGRGPAAGRRRRRPQAMADPGRKALQCKVQPLHAGSAGCQPSGRLRPSPQPFELPERWLRPRPPEARWLQAPKRWNSWAAELSPWRDQQASARGLAWR